MIKRIIEKNLEKMAKEILCLNDNEIKHFLKETKKEGVDEANQIEFMKTILSHVVNVEEEYYKEALYEQIHDFLSVFKMHGESYYFSVEMDNPIIESERSFRIPAYFSVADLCYAVLASYQAEGGHLFELKYKNDCFAVDFERDDALPANMIPLGNMELRKGSKLKLVYDFGENWEFVIRFDGKKKTDYADNIPELLSGKGYNIWEDRKWYLEMLIDNPQGLVEDFFGNLISIEEEANAEEIQLFDAKQNETFADRFFELKEKYEALDFDDLLEEFSGEYQA